MDLDKFLAKQELLMNNNPPACITECPIHVDVKGFIGEIKKENFEEAYRVLEKTIPLTNIIASVCDHPCESACLTYAKRNAVSIHELEKAVVAYGSKAKIKTLPIPENGRNIAVIGGGISGITCAADLKQKGYNVTIYEKENEVGGSLLAISEKIVRKELIREEIKRIEQLGIKIKLNHLVTTENLDEIMKEYEAAFLGTGVWDEELNYNGMTLQSEHENLFIGGRIVVARNSVIQSVFTGRCAAVSIDRFANKKSLTALRDKEGTYESNLKVDPDKKSIIPKVKPRNDIFTKEEAIKEANRCLNCECNKGIKTCIHLHK